MTLVIRRREEFGEDVLQGEWSERRNTNMFNPGAPVMAAENYCYADKQTRITRARKDGRLAKHLSNNRQACYSSWEKGRHVQFFPTYRPQVFLMVVEFLSAYLPPEMRDMSIVVRASKLSLEGTMLQQYPSVVEMVFEVFGLCYADYPNRAWLTWLSWLRAAWEFLPVKEVRETALEYLFLGWQMQKYSRDIHYPLYWKKEYVGRLTTEDIIPLLEALRDGYYKDDSLLQDQTHKLLRKMGVLDRERVEEEEPEEDTERTRNEFDDFEGWDDDDEPDEDYDEVDDEDYDLPPDDFEYRPHCNCHWCVEYRQNQKE